jgi:type IV pilus assembly protein PilO
LFAADIANLSRIVTLNNLSVSPIKDRDGFLTLDCVAKTFRYLDQEEVAMQQKAASGKAKAKAPGGKPEAVK